MPIIATCRLYYVRATKFPGFHLPLPGHWDKQSFPGTIPENLGQLATMSRCDGLEEILRAVMVIDTSDNVIIIVLGNDS